jgi:hypothetical protein
LQSTSWNEITHFLSAFTFYISSDLLYLWAMMDKYKLLSFYLGNLEGDNAASNDKTPGATSRKNRDLSGGCHTNKKQKQHDTSQ